MILLNKVTAPGVGLAVKVNLPNRTFQAVVSGTGTVSATVVVEVSNDGVNFMPLGTITLTGTSPQTDGFPHNAKYNYVRGNLTAISGTGAVVSCTMGVQ